MKLELLGKNELVSSDKFICMFKGSICVLLFFIFDVCQSLLVCSFVFKCIVFYSYIILYFVFEVYIWSVGLVIFVMYLGILLV